LAEAKEAALSRRVEFLKMGRIRISLKTRIPKNRMIKPINYITVNFSMRSPFTVKIMK
jgi:hypothetical protein